MPSQTRDSLATLTSLLIDDPNNRLFTAAQVLAKLQEAQERFVLDTRVLRDNSVITLVAGTQEYDIPTDAMDIVRVLFNGVPLNRKSKFELSYLSGSSRWDQDSGTPSDYYVDLDPNNKKIGLRPIPVSSGDLPVEYVKIPPALSSGSSVPLDGHTLLVPYHNALAYWSAKELLLIRPSSDNIAKAATYNKEYKDLISDCIETFKHMEQSQSWRLMGGRYHLGI
jgi:hypothetical protein